MDLKSSRTFHRLYYHIVWSTKNREPLIDVTVEKILLQFIRSKAHELDCEIIEINGVSDHLHLLVRLLPMMNISKIVKDLKGSSSNYLSQKSGSGIAFQWQSGYSAFTVSEKDLPNASRYIQRQKIHHQNDSLIMEWEA